MLGLTLTGGSEHCSSGNALRSIAAANMNFPNAAVSVKSVCSSFQRISEKNL